MAMRLNPTIWLYRLEILFSVGWYFVLTVKLTFSAFCNLGLKASCRSTAISCPRHEAVDKHHSQKFTKVYVPYIGVYFLTSNDYLVVASSETRSIN